MSYRLDELGEVRAPSLTDADGTAAQWPDSRAAIERTWREYLGVLPEPGPVRYRVVEESRQAGYVARRLIYESPGDAEVPALLLIPDGIDGKRTAAVVALHPTVKTGKDDVASPEGRDGRRYGVDLVQRGYVVLAPDTITAGERIVGDDNPYNTSRFYRDNPGWTADGRMLVDHRQAVSLLASLPEVDQRRIGAIGHSLGGYNGVFAAGLDDRISAVVSSCGFCVFAADPVPHRWGQRDWFSHIPRLSDDIRAGVVPFEWHEVFALMAPRPLLNWSGQQDSGFPNWRAGATAMGELSRLYGALGHGPNFVYLLGSSPHDFPADIRELSYRFLDQHLEPARIGE